MQKTAIDRLLRSMAALSLCLVAPHPARAETDITTTTTAPVITSTANNGSPDDVVITSTGVVQGANVTLNSNNSVNNQGVISILDVNRTAGIAVTSSVGSVISTGTITVTDAAPNTAPPPFTGSGLRYGILVQGSSPFNGSIVVGGGSITVLGNDSAGVWATSGLAGALTLNGSITITGDRSTGALVSGPVGGGIQLGAPMFVHGTASPGLVLNGPVGGQIYIANSIFTTGYLDATRPSTINGLGANNYLQGGSALIAQGNVTGGIFVDAAGLVYSASGAPSLLVGGGANSELGIAGPGANAYGLLIGGTVKADGIYDGFGPTAIQIGGQGGSVIVDQGVKVIGSVTANAYSANATAISIAGGSTVANLVNTGSISATARYGYNGVTGGNAAAVVDNSGSLISVQNTGTILASGAGGKATALDLRANATGVTVTQMLASAASAPSITGDILFGSGTAQLNLLGGTLNGAVAFGGAADSLTIANGALMTGALSETGKPLTVAVASGRLGMTNTSTTTLTSLQVGSGGEIDFGIDPVNGKTGQLHVVGATILSVGSKIGLDFQSKLTQPVTVTLIQSGTLSTGALSQPLLVGELPYFYTGNISADIASGTVTMSVRPRTGSELGMVGASAIGGVLNAFDRDPAIRGAFDSALTPSAFGKLYQQMLPDYAGGLFEVLSEGSAALARVEGDVPSAMRTDRNGYWAAQIGFGAERDGAVAPSYRGGGLGLAFGWETPQRSLGAFGVSATYMLTSADDRDTGPYNTSHANAYLIGAYWHDLEGGFKADASINGGYVGFDSSRNFAGFDGNGTSFTRDATAHWGAALINSHLGVAYQRDLGGFFMGPELSGDAFLLYEGGHSEVNGGDAFDIKVASRTGKQEIAQAALVIGTEFGEGFLWRPEIKLGWQQTFGGADSTLAQFVSGGPTFTLEPQAQKGGPDARIILRGGNQFSDVSFEAGGESRGNYHAFDGRLVARVHL